MAFTSGVAEPFGKDAVGEAHAIFTSHFVRLDHGVHFRLFLPAACGLRRMRAVAGLGGDAARELLCDWV